MLITFATCFFCIIFYRIGFAHGNEKAWQHSHDFIIRSIDRAFLGDNESKQKFVKGMRETLDRDVELLLKK